VTVRPKTGPLAIIAGGLVLLCVAILGACRSQPPPDRGAAEVTRLASPPASGPSVAVADGALPTGTAVVAPNRVRIPDRRRDARVDPVGVNPKTNDFEVPPAVDLVGWYRYGPGLEATAGSVVIAGHVDSAEQGAGAFFKLRSLEPGARIEVTGADGAVRAYRVVGRETYAKSAIPLEKYFARDGAPRLTLITCGGPFDRGARSYRDNVVVTATISA